MGNMFDRDALHKDRRGGDLFNKVFIEGWHGGAESGPGHPSAGLPRYRVPTPYYTHWGPIAYRTESPFEIFTKNLDAEESNFDDVYMGLMEKYNAQFESDIISKFPEIVVQTLSHL